jgi:two-component system nitrogen regulation response regulator NtrX
MAKILLIDDSRFEREVTTSFLEKAGYAVLSLQSAQHCIETIENEGPDLVILDIMMPEFDGMQALRQIRELWSQIELPVVMISGKADASDVIEALKRGANDFISKPFDFDIVKMRLQTQLTISGLSKKLVQNGLQPTPDPDKPES